MNLASLLQLPSLLVPDQVAAIDHRPGEPDAVGVTYADLWGEATLISGWLRSSGLPTGSRIAVMSTNRVRVLSIVFGAAAAGMVCVPLNFRASVDELAHLVQDSEPPVIIAESRYLEVLRRVAPRTPLIPIDLPRAEFVAALGAPDPVEDVHDPEPGEFAVVLYTSGTSSRPKGVCITHPSLSRYAMETNDAADGTNSDVMLVSAPLSHVAALTSVTNSIYAGRRLVLIPQFDVEPWFDAVRRYGVTHSFVVPTMLHRLIDSPHLETADLSSLRSVTYGAAPMPPSVIRRAIEVLPSSIDFVGAYGQTETTSTVAVLGPDDHRMDGDDDQNRVRWQRLGSVGRVLDDVEVRIIDDAGTDLGHDEVGEVLLRTYRSMAGYWGGAGGTRITIDSDGWVHTGDLGRIDPDGYLFLHGRRGDMIIRGGENVIPEEVEDALLECPGIVEAGVVGVEGEDAGEDILAVIVVRPGTRLDDVREQIRQRLPAYKRPTEYRLADELPRTATGKLLRRGLADLVSRR